MTLPAKSPQNTRLSVSLCFPLLEALNDSCRSARCDFISFLIFAQLGIFFQGIIRGGFGTKCHIKWRKITKNGPVINCYGVYLEEPTHGTHAQPCELTRRPGPNVFVIYCYLGTGRAISEGYKLCFSHTHIPLKC